MLKQGHVILQYELYFVGEARKKEHTLAALPNDFLNMNYDMRLGEKYHLLVVDRWSTWDSPLE